MADTENTNIDEETDWILQEWEHVINQLEQDPLQLVGKIDWITKRWLLDSFVQDEGIGWDDPWLASLDLEYHNLDPERGLFFGLEADGRGQGLCPRSHRAVRRAAEPAHRPAGGPRRDRSERDRARGRTR